LKVAQEMIAYYEKSALTNADFIAGNAVKNYQNGEISYIEFLQANQTVLEIRSKYLMAILNFNQAVINLQYLLNQ